MPTGRSGLTGVRFGNELFLFGGYFLSGGVVPQSKVEVYNLNTNLWRTASDMPVARLGIDAAPNPFSLETEINYSVSKTEHIKLIVSNILGSEEAALVDGVKSPGDYTIQFRSDHLAKGLYPLRLIGNSKISTTKILKRD